MTYKIIMAIVEMFGSFAVGGLARKLKYIDDTSLDKWSKFIVDFFMPMLAFTSIFNNLRPETAWRLWPLPLIGFGLMLLGAVMGMGLKFGMKYKTEDNVKTFLHLCAVNNYSFLPIIVILNIFGESCLPLLFILNIGSSIAYWTIGVALLGKTEVRTLLKNIFSVNLIVIILALAVTMLGLKSWFPPFIINICSGMGNSAVPLMLIIIGASLCGTVNIFKNKWDMFYLTVCRLAIIPAASVLILMALPLPKEVFEVSLVVSLMPVSVSSTLITRVYGGSPEYAGQAAVMTTVASVLTVPLFLKLFF